MRRVVLLAVTLFSLLPSLTYAAKPGRSGTLYLYNGTPYEWRSSDVSSTLMPQWNFPSVIMPSTIGIATVEYGEGRGFPYGEVTYTLGTSYSFKIVGRQTTGRLTLTVELTNLELPGYPKGSSINLRLVPDGAVTFVVIGTSGSFYSNLTRSAWMQDNLGMLGSRSLRHLCIPGSHDAGMSKVTGGTALATACNTVTQELDVFGQLKMGVRYFDIRPVISGGKFFTGHYSNTPLGWQGKNGQSIASVIADVNDYVADNHELIILHFSHDLNTDANYRPFTQLEWDRLLSELRSLRSRVELEYPNVDLTTVKLADFIGSGAAVVVVAEAGNPGVTFDSLGMNWVYTTRNFPVFNQYSDTEHVQTMVDDQLAKLRAQRFSPDAGYFLLSWTLTQSDEQAVFCGGAARDSSIRDLARIANASLHKVLPSCTRWTYPNIIFVDGVQNFDVAALAMSVNNLAASSTPQAHVFYKGAGSSTSMYVAHSPDRDLANGSAWNPVRINGILNTSDTPSTLFYKGSLFTFYKGAGGDSRIFVGGAGSYILDGNAWNAGPLNPAINTSTTPALAALNGTPYMFYKGAGADTNVYIGRAAGNFVAYGNLWSAQRLTPSINTSTAPAATAFGGALYMVYKGSGDDANIYIGRSSGDVFDGNTWSANRLNPAINTSAAPGVIVYGGYLYVFFKGFGADTNIYIARSRGRDVFDGSSWEYARLNPGINTTAAPKPLLVGDSLYVFYKGSGDDNIWVAQPLRSNPFDGNAWRWDRLNPAITTSTGPGADTTW